MPLVVPPAHHGCLLREACQFGTSGAGRRGHFGLWRACEADDRLV